MPSIFTRIINREIPGHIVAEDDHHIAFLDINPLVPGHTLVVPKLEVDYLFDLEDGAFCKLQLFSKKVADALEQAMPCLRIGVSVIGLEVPHCHIHLIPINSMDDMNFSRPKLNPTQDELTVIANRIRQILDPRS
ncbi:MAG: HIT family protein [Cyclobacteriaceae bacterium]|nr:MAG: HIT family protein [Cyclobacteriaceae bacterium]